MSEEAFDLIVLGGGPGGYVAAIRASQLGMRTALVEREHLGGICLNWGCIPTKALLHTAAVYRQMQGAAALGLDAAAVSFDFERMIARSRAVAGRLNRGVQQLMAKNRITVFEGHGRLLPPGGLEVLRDGAPTTILRSANIILATGGHPRTIPGIAPDGERIWNYRHALSAGALPASLLVIGAGAIGMEFASFYRTFGSEVTVVETQDRILPAEDAEISRFVRAEFEKNGVRILTSVTVTKVESIDAGARVSLDHEGQAELLGVERVLVSVGVVGNTAGLNLERTAVEIAGGHVVTDAAGFTGVAGLFAIGDLAGGPWLAHKASHDAITCVERIAGHGETKPLLASRIPSCTYCHPQVASIGLTEEQARLKTCNLRVGRFPFQGNGKAIALDDAHGFVKTLFDGDTGELLGAHMVGPDVTELIHGFGIAQTLEATERELMETVFPHPSLSEAMHEAVLSAFDRTLHA